MSAVRPISVLDMGEDMGTLDRSDRNDAVFVIQQTRDIIEEAKRLPECGPLVALLTERLSKLDAEFQRFVEEIEPAFLDADRALKRARAEETRTRLALFDGSLDREEAVRLHGDHVHAEQVVRIRERLWQKAKASVDSALFALCRWSRNRDRHRESAELQMIGMANTCLGGHEPRGYQPASDSPEQAIWEPLFEARELAAYAELSQRPEHKRLAVELDDLRAAFAARRSARAAHRAAMRAKLEAELGALGAA